MNLKIRKWLRLGYQIALSLSIVVAGLCLMAQCLVIYQSGDKPFSRESVAAAFSEIAAPVYICGALVLVGVLLAPLFPAHKQKPEKNYRLICDRLRFSTDLDACPEELSKAIYQLELHEMLVSIIGGVILVICSVIFLLWGAKSDNFDSTQISASMVSMMYWLIPCMAVPFGYSIFAAYYRKRSIMKEIELLKAAPKEAKCQPERSESKPFDPKWARLCVLAAAIALFVGGYAMGGAVDVLTKAVNICTECIGLG